MSWLEGIRTMSAGRFATAIPCPRGKVLVEAIDRQPVGGLWVISILDKGLACPVPEPVPGGRPTGHPSGR